jgi:hypothetical protein
MAKNITDGLSDIGQYVIEELAKEIIKQDHSNTGKLIDSLDYNVNTANTSIDVYMNDYGRYVNTGRKRGARKVPIQALVEWIKQRGIETNNKKALGIAFAIQKTIEKQGSPTVNSRKKGKRTEFVDDTIERISNKVENMVADVFEKEIEIQLDNFVKRI